MGFIHKFTKGEWLTDNIDFYIRDGSHKDIEVIEVEDEQNNSICFVSFENQTLAEGNANVNLIRQAPKLLEFAEMLHDQWNCKEKKPALLKQLKEVITNAGVEITH